MSTPPEDKPRDLAEMMAFYLQRYHYLFMYIAVVLTAIAALLVSGR